MIYYQWNICNSVANNNDCLILLLNILAPQIKIVVHPTECDVCFFRRTLLTQQCSCFAHLACFEHGHTIQLPITHSTIIHIGCNQCSSLTVLLCQVQTLTQVWICCFDITVQCINVKLNAFGDQHSGCSCCELCVICFGNTDMLTTTMDCRQNLVGIVAGQNKPDTVAVVFHQVTHGWLYTAGIHKVCFVNQHNFELAKRHCLTKAN